LSEAIAQYAKVSTETISRLRGVNRIYQAKGTHPDVIYILFPHGKVIGGIDYGAPVSHLDSVKSICKGLKANGIQDILIDGMHMAEKEMYLNHGKFSGGYTTSSAQSMEKCLEDVLSLGWNIRISEDVGLTIRERRLMEPIDRMNARFREDMVRTARELVDRYSAFDGRVQMFKEENHQALRDDWESAYAHATKMYSMQLKKYFENKNVLELYQLICTERERGCAVQALECRKSGGQLIILFGNAHARSMLRELDKHGLSYAGILPNGLPDSMIIDSNLDALRRSYEFPKKAPPIVLDIKTDKFRDFKY
jgi:hypothetical protein